jgi:hypothetical protein
MNRIIFLFLSIFICSSISAQVTLGYYLPKEVSYNPSIPTPKQFAGHEVGEWHLTHDKIYFYMLELAKISDRAIWEEYGRSYEGRPLGQLIISSPENIKNIEQLRQQHLLLCDPAKSDNQDIKNMPIFIKLGYGVHGNESSAQNASVLTAYYLLAGEGKQVEDILKNAVILIDPALNPDGMQRHSTWVNFTKSLNNNPDPNSWEFSESYPGGRTNHYWFDLNRDYIMLQHPESVGRVAAFYKWRPNINTDHHEMGANATFFFQPGIQSRNNPLTPPENQELTAEIGKFHEKYLNSIGSLYYTEESFDDFYVGKGSSYPDIHGSVGILFEQAGVKGHLKETPGGSLTFPFAIRNQFTVSLSSIDAGLKMKERLLDSQRRFYKDALNQADKYPVKAYIFTEPSDKARTSEFIKNLLRHQIKVFRLARDMSKNGVDYKAENSYVVPLKQNEYLFVRSLFEPVKEFTDSTFYDISTWVLPMSFNIQYAGINLPKEMEGLSGAEILNTPELTGKLTGSKDAYAYLFEWNEYYTPKALYTLQNEGLICRVATSKFVSAYGTDKKEFSFGTIMVPAYGQALTRDEIFILMETVAKDCGITVYGVSTGLTPQGIDLGSNGFSVLKKPSVIMITGEGTNSGDVGEIWHMFDTRFNIPVTMATAARISSMDLDRYNVLIVTGTPEISAAGIENIKSWNRKGGTIIAYESGNNWLIRNKLAEIEFLPVVVNKRSSGVYANRSGDSQVQQIPGSIFEVKLDVTNPLCYGYSRPTLPVFKSSATAAIKDPGLYNNPIMYTANPLLSGYCTKENIDRIKNSAFVSTHGSRIISIYDNTNFRAIWFGTNKIFMNAVFFGQIMGGRGGFDGEE